MSEFVTRKEYEEHNLRMDDEHKRQNRRIEKAEQKIEENNKLIIAVEKIANSVEQMQKEMSTLRSDVDDIKNRDGQKWRKTIEDISKIVLGVLIGYVLKQIGIY